jgi:hypothetical protein
MGGTGTTSSSTSSGDPCTEADCSNPNCQSTYSCVASAPAGWTGYFALYDGPPAGDPGCGGPYPTSAFLGNNQLTAPQASCSTCTCAAPQGSTCETNGPVDPDPMYPNTLDIIETGDAPCGNNPNCVGPLQAPIGWNGACYGPNGFLGSQTCGAGSDCTNGTGACSVSVRANALKVTGGSCVPSQEMPNVPQISWGVAGEACGGAKTDGVGCNPGQSCLPKPTTPFQQGVCIQQAGDLACPPGQFSQKHLFYGAAVDTRSCTSCTCGAAAGGSCSGTIKVFSDQAANSCPASNLIATLNVTSQAGACADLVNNPAVVGRSATLSAVSGGACPPSGGQPTGTAIPDPATATTFCCIP